jgi:hypothetical protein
MSRFSGGAAKRRREGERRALLRGEEVVLDGRLRQTSARGWGPWTDVVLTVPPLPDTGIGWYVEDPLAVGLPATHGPIVEPLGEVDEVWLRPVRFPTEAFWGLDAEIVVLGAGRSTTEVALPPEVTAPVFDRLEARFGGDTGGSTVAWFDPGDG